MRTFLARLCDWWRRREIDAAFAEEMQFHLEQLERDYRARGLSAEQAHDAAVREFGNPTRAREELRARAGFPLVEEFFRDVRHAWRGLFHRPILAIGVVVVLAAGLGAAAILTNVTRAVLFAPLPVPDSDELHLVVAPDGAQPERLSYATARRLDALLSGGSAAGYTGSARFIVQRDGQPAARINGELVTGNFFGMLRLAPLAGRLLEMADDQIGAPSVAVVSHAWAVQEFGSPRAAVGRELWVNRHAVSIVGVLSASFQSTTLGRRTDLWLPASLQVPVRYSGNARIIASDDRTNDPDWTREERVAWLLVMARLPAESRLSAAAALEEAWKPQRESILAAMDDPAEREQLQHHRIRIVPAPGGFSNLRAGFRSTGTLLGALVGIVLILACANVSGLLLVRTLSRHRELGVRMALGSGRWRIARLAMAEALILCAGGAMAGWILSLVLTPAVTGLLVQGREIAEAVVDPWQLALMGGLTVGCAALSGIGPALLIARMEPLTALAGHGGLRGAAGRIGRVLVGAQLALAVVLVAVAYTLGVEVARVLAADPGFARSTVLTTSFDARAAGYQPEEIAPLTDRLDQTLRSIPGVVDVSFSSNGILNGSISRSSLTFRDPRALVHSEHCQGEVVRPGYFEVTGMTLLTGRDLTPDDRAGTQPVVVISAAFARRVFGDFDPIGQRFGFGSTPSDDDFTVVGVVSDAKLNGIRTQAPAVFYRPAAQASDSVPSFVVIRIQGNAATVQASAKAALARMEPGLVFPHWRTLQERVTDDLGPSRAATKIAATFAIIAIVLASAGVAASLGYLVTLRQRELALRIAIGADPATIRRNVLIDAVKLGVTGAAAGLVLIWLLPLIPAIGSLLPARPDLMVGVVAASVGIAATVTAGWSPARRAARADLLLLLKLE